MPEAWLSGPVPGVPAALLPVAHSLLDALADLRAAAEGLDPSELWGRPGSAASVGFHLRHVAGSTRRLLTYARGEALSPEQLSAIPVEAEPGDPPATAASLLAELDAAVAEALDALRTTDPDTLLDVREVGRSRLPSTVGGILFHAAEHARRHAGQAVATSAFLRGLGGGAGARVAGRVPTAPGGEAGAPGAPERIRAALIAAARQAYEEGGIRRLRAEGRWELALDAMGALELDGA